MEILNLKFNMATSGLCSIIEAEKIAYYKALLYQDMLISKMQQQNNTEYEQF